MQEDTKNLSRRTFLAAGSAVVASSVLAADLKAATSSDKVSETGVATPPATEAAVLTNDPVYTDSVQTLTHKTISGRDNTIINIGTEYINIKSLSSFPTALDTNGQFDITAALDAAIGLIGGSPSKGGQILIPQGVWHTNGGHDFADCISIEGVSSHVFNRAGSATNIKLKSGILGGEDYVFGITGSVIRFNCSLKNMTVDMADKSSATGLLMSNSAAVGSGDNAIYRTYVENVGFHNGAYGIKVVSAAALASGFQGVYASGTTYSSGNVVLFGTSYYTYTGNSPSTQPPSNPAYWTYVSTLGSFECILNVFNRVTLGCNVGFYCETNNSGFEFNSPYLYLTGSGTSVGFYCYIMGALTVNNHQCVGPNISPTDNSTLLRTVGGFNTIVFQNGGQDENVEYLYQNSTNDYGMSPIVFRNCLIQSKVKVTADTTFVSDSNYFVNAAAEGRGPAVPTFYDTNTYRNGDYHGWYNLYLMGKNAVESRIPSTGAQAYGNEKLVYLPFNNQHSKVIDPFGAPFGYGYHP